MKVNTSVVSASGYKCWVSCAACGKRGPEAEGGDRLLTRQRAVRAAMDANDGHGSLWWLQGNGEVLCIRCVVERLPDVAKKRNPGLCRRVGVPVPGEEEAANQGVPAAAGDGAPVTPAATGRKGKRVRPAKSDAAPGGQ
jgi:hypothetical protein